MCIHECDSTHLHKRKKRPTGLFVKTDSVSLDSSMAAPASPSARLHSPSAFTASGWDSVVGLLATPKNLLNSARRALYSAPWEEDGNQKVWLRLELRLGIETLIAGAGNGRLGWLIQALRRDFSKILDLELSQVRTHVLIPSQSTDVTAG